jgi:hypothetical protein
MKIENPTIVAALNRAAQLLNRSPSSLVDYFLQDLVDRINETPVDVLSELAAALPYDTEAQAETAADRLSELAVSESLEGNTPLTIACEVVGTGSCFRLEVSQLRENGGQWMPAL